MADSEGERKHLQKWGEKMSKSLKVKVIKDKNESGVVRLRRVGVREKIMKFLLGPVQNLTILVPGDGVDKISIYEKGEEDVKNKATNGNQRRCRESCI